MNAGRFPEAQRQSLGAHVIPKMVRGFFVVATEITADEGGISEQLPIAKFIEFPTRGDERGA
jgi:hypothetical protein